MGFHFCKVINHEEDKEMEVLNEIFVELAYKMGVIDIMRPPPPPPPPIADSNNRICNSDTLGYHEVIRVFDERIKKLKSDTAIVIAIVDSLLSYDVHKNYEFIKKQLPSPEYIEALDAMTDNSITSRPLDLNQIKNKNGFKLKYYSEFPKEMTIWEEENYDFTFSGIMGISRIYFDNSDLFGLISCSFMCGSLCGNGTIVCIRKIDNKWTVEKTIVLWIS